jgi:hypothetical protein
MARVVSLLGLFIGCAFVAIAMAGSVPSGDVEAREGSPEIRNPNCHIEEILLDEGYGVSRKEQREVCAEPD